MTTAEHPKDSKFLPINTGYDSLFKPNRMTIGLVVPIESYPAGPVPEMARHVERVRLAESLGFSGVWLRDIPFNIPSFGDAGQIFDPFVYLGALAAVTSTITLGVASVVLPLRHPAHIAKAAASVDVLSEGRLVVGVASGDRPDEYPAMNLPFAERGTLFRSNFNYIRQMAAPSTTFVNKYGTLPGTLDMLPKPVGKKLPLLITGRSQQELDWIAQNGDGWMLYPRSPTEQARIISDWRQRVTAANRLPKPIMQPLHIDLDDNPDAPARPIHLGYHLGSRMLLDHLHTLAEVGVNHVALNLRFNEADTEVTLQRLADEVLPHFSQERK